MTTPGAALDGRMPAGVVGGVGASPMRRIGPPHDLQAHAHCHPRWCSVAPASPGKTPSGPYGGVRSRGPDLAIPSGASERCRSALLLRGRLVLSAATTGALQSIAGDLWCLSRGVAGAIAGASAVKRAPAISLLSTAPQHPPLGAWRCGHDPKSVHSCSSAMLPREQTVGLACPILR